MQAERRFIWADEDRPDDHDSLPLSGIDDRLVHAGGVFVLRDWTVGYSTMGTRVTRIVYDEVTN